MARKVAGLHLVADLSSCRVNFREHTVLERLLAAACREAGLTVVGTLGKTLSGPQGTGATAVILLAESHAAVHTWPEWNYAAVDVFGCGDAGRVRKAFELICSLFKAERVRVQELERVAEVARSGE